MSLVLPMSQVQDQALKRVFAVLNSLKCEYAIVDPWGNKHGNLELAEIQKSPRKYPHGEKSTYVRSFMQMEVGEVKTIPCGKFDPIEIQASATSAAHRDWGVGSVMTTISREKHHVEILRIL